VLKVEDLDPRFGNVEYAMVLVRTRHLALQAARAFVGVDVQRFLHFQTPPSMKYFFG
jgi:hypothetical protein